MSYLQSVEELQDRQAYEHEQMVELEDALKEYPRIPEDVFIGRNRPADKVRWLIRRLIGTENTLRNRTP
jgi:hypothetical protein